MVGVRRFSGFGGGKAVEDLSVEWGQQNTKEIRERAIRELGQLALGRSLPGCKSGRWLNISPPYLPCQQGPCSGLSGVVGPILLADLPFERHLGFKIFRFEAKASWYMARGSALGPLLGTKRFLSTPKRTETERHHREFNN